MSNLSKDYHSYIHTDSSIKTLNELVDGASNPVSIIRNISIGVLLRYEDENGITNLEKLWAKYPLLVQTKEQKNKFDNNLEYLKGFTGSLNETISEPADGFLTDIYPNTVFAIPLQKLNRDTLIGEGNQIVDQEFEAFIAKKLKELQVDTKYYPLFKTDLGTKGSIKQQFPNMTVWMWCRSLTPIPSEGVDSNLVPNPDGGLNLDRTGNEKVRGSDTEPLGGTFIDLTPFIDAMNISVTAKGGTFGFTLPPIIGLFDPNLGWKIKRDSLKTYIYKGETNYTSQGGYEDKYGNLNSFYFHNIIRENDLIFIRFETLNNEIKQRIKDKQYSSLETNFEIPKEEIAGKIYDMIGMIDTNTITKNPGENDVQINLQGRDLMKLLIEDACVFTPLNFTPEGGYFSNQSDDRMIQRIEGQLHTLVQGAEKTLEFSLKYIINTLSNMGIVPNDLFTSYVHLDSEGQDVQTGEQKVSKTIDERSYKFKLDIASKKARQKRANDLADRARKIKDKIGKVRESEKIPNPYASSEVGDVFITLQNFIEIGYNKEGLESFLNPKNSQNTITGWDSFPFQGVNVDENLLPAIFNYHFIIPKKYYTDQNGKKVTGADKEKLLNDWEDYNKELQRYKDSIGDTENFSQDEPPPLKLTARDKRKQSLKELIAGNIQMTQENTNRENAKFATASTTNADNASKDENLFKLREAENQAQLDKLHKMQAENERLAALYNNFTAYFHEDPRSWDSLNSQAKEVLNDILQYVVLNSREEEPDRYTKELCSGVWQIVKLVIDDEVQERRLVDNSIGNENGSIITHLNKICQEPFVELYTDTYKDQFYIVARKPPFTKAKIREHIDRGLVINIEPGEISRMNLNMSQGMGYSMYRITPQSAFMAGQEAVTWAYLKAIYFPEYADIWGLKFMDVVCQYIPHFPLINEGKDIGSGYAIEQAIRDLQFLIETNMYLPFTREGDIEIKGGDRRFKRGTWIRIVETGEIYYVETVNNSIVKSEGVDRATTLMLTRGMKERSLDYYFSLINLNIKEKITKSDNYEQWIKDVVGNWKVNKGIFNYLLRNEQFK